MSDNLNLISIRFVGDELNTKGVPIYDLAQSLIAIQRIIHKAYLAHEGRLSETFMASRSEREILALRIGERKRNSDEYGLVTYLTDPALVQVMAGVVSSLISGLALYAYQRNIATRESEKAPPVIYNISIYNQVVELANRVNGVGGVQQIEIFGVRDGYAEKVVIDSATQDYVRGLKHRLVAGEERTLVGKLREMNPEQSSITLTDDLKSISVSLPKSEFETIRYSKVSFPRVTVLGKPIYRLGVEGDVFERFDGTSVISVEEFYGEEPPLPEDTDL